MIKARSEITKASSPEEYEVDKNNNTNQIGEIKESGSSFVVFVEMLDSNWVTIDPFFTRSEQKDLHVQYLSQLCLIYQKKNKKEQQYQNYFCLNNF